MGFKINRVYTRSGDKGETSLIDGSRVKKNDFRCLTFGGLDEVNCHLGLAKDTLKLEIQSDLKAEQKEKLNEVAFVIEHIQQEIFDLGSELACPKDFNYPNKWSASTEHVKDLESLCDRFNRELSELASFILPGGNQSSSHLHLARAVTRRVERDIITFKIAFPEEISEFVLQYCNRLSDLLFVLARYVLQVLNIDPPLWKKGEERKLNFNPKP